MLIRRIGIPKSGCTTTRQITWWASHLSGGHAADSHPLRPMRAARTSLNYCGEVVMALKGILYGMTPVITRFHTWTISIIPKSILGHGPGGSPYKGHPRDANPYKGISRENPGNPRGNGLSVAGNPLRENPVVPGLNSLFETALTRAVSLEYCQ